ncbi:MAG: ribosomal protein S18-alanine N-acetyltransferase [Deltaproteobacteria bacterium]|nr:ribosomal protein S18-alanine N-acetyltransferase [Deltaproteobacteria bacterium]
MTDQVDLRACSVADAAIVEALEVQCFADAWKAASVRNEVAVEHGRAWLAICAGEPVGYLLAWLVGDEAQINRVGVVPLWRGRGLGQALVRNCLAMVAEQGARSALLEVHAGNGAALVLYRRCGFVQIGRRKAYYPDGGDALVLRIALRPEEPVVDSTT